MNPCNPLQPRTFVETGSSFVFASAAAAVALLNAPQHGGEGDVAGVPTPPPTKSRPAGAHSPPANSNGAVRRRRKWGLQMLPVTEGFQGALLGSCG